MQKIFFVVLFFNFLFSYEEPISDKTAFEVLMFKTGVTSLTKDFEIEKENIANNTKEIEALKKEVEYLLQENLKLKLKTEQSDTKAENKLLKEELERLRKKVDTTQQKDQFLYGKVFDQKASSVNTPFPNATIVSTYVKNQLLILEWCNRYGWCKIKDKDEYIAQYKLFFVKKDDIR